MFRTHVPGATPAAKRPDTTAARPDMTCLQAAPRPQADPLAPIPASKPVAGGPLPSPLHLADFRLGRVVGTGSFGRVRIARHRATGEVVAIKSIDKATCIREGHVSASRLLLMFSGLPCRAVQSASRTRAHLHDHDAWHGSYPARRSSTSWTRRRCWPA